MSDQIPTCPYCQHQFQTRSGLNQHLRTVVACIRQQEEQGIQVLLKKDILCTDCSKSFTSKQSLEYHTIRCKVKAAKVEKQNG